MTENFGNLALQRKRSATSARPSRTLPMKRPQPMEFKTKRIPVTATPAPEQTTRANAHAIRRSLALQRLKLLAISALIVIVVTGVFALVVYRQAHILEMNFYNLSVERQITKLDQDSSQIKESLAQQTNLDLIRQLAISRLGLQDPAGSQIILVDMPDTDRVVFSGSSSVSTDNEAYLASVFTTLEGYFKSMSQKRQGD